MHGFNLIIKDLIIKTIKYSMKIYLSVLSVLIRNFKY